EHVRLMGSGRWVSMLQRKRMGAQLELAGDQLRVRGVPALTSAHLSSFNDHRVLMSLAVAASAAEGRSTLTYPNAYQISYPRFLEPRQALGGDVDGEHARVRP